MNQMSVFLPWIAISNADNPTMNGFGISGKVSGMGLVGGEVAIYLQVSIFPLSIHLLFSSRRKPIPHIKKGF